MRNTGFTFVLTLLCLFSYTLPSSGQLPSRSELLSEKYEEDRAKGITALNKRYIAILKKELDSALSGAKLEEANWIQSKIEILKAEIKNSQRSKSSSISTAEEKSKAPDFLVGKKIEFPNNSYPLQKAYFAFEKEGKASYIGLGGQTVERKYEPTGKSREFILTWPERQDDFSTYLITVSPDGKTAKLVLRYNNKTSDGIIQRGN